jgi:hypothetical protein
MFMTPCTSRERVYHEFLFVYFTSSLPDDEPSHTAALVCRLVNILHLLIHILSLYKRVEVQTDRRPSRLQLRQLALIMKQSLEIVIESEYKNNNRQSSWFPAKSKQIWSGVGSQASQAAAWPGPIA